MKFTMINLYKVIFALSWLSVSLGRRTSVDTSQLSNEAPKSVFVRVQDDSSDALVQSLLALETQSDTLSFHQFAKLRNYIAVKGTRTEIESLVDNPDVDDILDDPLRFLAKERSLRGPQNVDLMTQTVDYGVELISALGAHSLGYAGQDIKVCVVDTGIDLSHPDIDSTKFSGGGPHQWDQDGYGHGTHVTGIIAALNNDIGTLGAAFNVSIIVQRIFDDFGGSVTSESVMEAVEDCVDAGAQIINLSLGGSQSSEAEETFFRNIREQDGVLVVAAGGNSGSSDYEYPASYNTVLGVAAVDQDKDVAYFSQKNDRIDLAAPGVDTLSLLPTTGPCYGCDFQFGGFGTMSGTSMATPYVVAAAAAVWSAAPLANASTVEEALLATAQDLGTPGKDDSYGHGLVNVTGAVLYILGDEGDGGCSDEELFFQVSLRTDFYAGETSWLLKRQSDGGLHLAGAGFQSHQDYHVSSCIRKDCYVFVMQDSYGDGLCSGHGEGSYSLSVDGEEIASGCDFGYMNETSFGECSDIPVPPKPDPTDPPTDAPTEPPTCEDFELTMNTDQYGSEIGVSLFNNITGADIFDYQGLGNSRSYTWTECLDPEGYYTLKVTDFGGDGICCDYGLGNFTARFAGDEFISDGQYGFGIEHNFGTCPYEEFELTMNTDRYGDEIGVSLINDITGAKIWDLEGLGSFQAYSWKTCLDPEDFYTLRVTDRSADGACCGHGLGNFTASFAGEEFISDDQCSKTIVHNFGTCSYEEFELVMNTDQYGSEIGVRLVNDITGDEIWDFGGLSSFQAYTLKTCLDPLGCYNLTVSDRVGDGICCDHGLGNFTASFAGEDYVSDGQYGSSVSFNVGTCS